VETAFFFLPKTKSEVIAVIAATKFGWKFRFRGDDALDIMQILIAQLAQAIGD
jgi:hypothetical protein